MSQRITITNDYFKKYRKDLGFTSQGTAREFFGAKNITPTVDFNYVTLLNNRLCEIVDKLSSVVVPEIRIGDISEFKKKHIDDKLVIMKQNNILPRLNNQGRRPEQVYFSWTRGYVVSQFFLKALGIIFEVDIVNIELIGDDDLGNIQTFKRTPKADLEIMLPAQNNVRIEIQSGFTGINDIKQHKVLEAKRVFNELKLPTLAIHFDLFNGQVAFVQLDQIEDNSVNWITRQQMEGQTVFNIDQNYFLWKLTETPPLYREMNLNE